MKRRARTYVIDVYAGDPPDVGAQLREDRHDGTVRGYSQVLERRQVRVRVSRGEKSRWRLWLSPVSETAGKGRVFIVTDHPPKKKTDRFSPLL